MCTAHHGQWGLCSEKLWDWSNVFIHHLDENVCQGPRNQNQHLCLGPVCVQTQAKIRTWRGLDCVEGNPGLLKQKWRELLHVVYIVSSIAVRLRQVQSWCRAVKNSDRYPGWAIMPPLPLTQGVEEILGACSRSAAWRSLGRASGTAEENDTTDKTVITKHKSFTRLKQIN